MNRDRYRIGKISSLMGITSEALRYYEHEGVITPQKSEESGYRMYDAWDVHMLIRTRLYRSYGFSLAETVEALDSNDPATVEQMLKAKEEEMRCAIQRQRMLLRQLEYDRYTLRDCMRNVGKFRVEHNHAMHFIETQNSYSIMDGRFEFYNSWIEKVPYATSGGVFEEDYLHYGLMVADMNLTEEDEAIMEGTLPIPAQKCLTTFFQSGSENELNIGMFEPAIEFLDRYGLKPSSNPFAKAVLMTKADEHGVYNSWYKGWVPFEGEFEFAAPPWIPEKAKPFSYEIN